MRSRHCSARTVSSGESRASSRTMVVLETRLPAGSAVQRTLSSGVARHEKTRYRLAPLICQCRARRAAARRRERSTAQAVGSVP